MQEANDSKTKGKRRMRHLTKNLKYYWQAEQKRVCTHNAYKYSFNFGIQMNSHGFYSLLFPLPSRFLLSFPCMFSYSYEVDMWNTFFFTRIMLTQLHAIQNKTIVKLIGKREWNVLVYPCTQYSFLAWANT